VLNVLRGQSLSAPSAMFLGLLLNNPGEAGAGTEISYTGYQRLPLTFSEPAFDNALQAFGITNTNSASFAESSITAGTVTYIGLYDSVSGGNMWVYGMLESPIEVDPGESPQIIPGEIKLFTTGDKTDSLRTMTLNALRGISISGLSTFVGLLNNGVELAAANYARVALTFNAPVEGAAGVATITNSLPANFAQATTVWGIYNEFGIYNAASGGTLLWRKSRGSDRMINRLKRVTLPTGALIVGVN